MDILSEEFELDKKVGKKLQEWDDDDTSFKNSPIKDVPYLGQMFLDPSRDIEDNNLQPKEEEKKRENYQRKLFSESQLERELSGEKLPKNE